MEKDNWCSPTNSTCSDKLLHTCVHLCMDTQTHKWHTWQSKIGSIHSPAPTNTAHVGPPTREPQLSTYEYCTRRPTTREQPLKILLQTMPTPSVWSIFNFSPNRNICFPRRPTNWLRSVCVCVCGGGGRKINNSISGTLVRLWKGSKGGKPFAKSSLSSIMRKSEHPGNFAHLLWFDCQ